MPRPLRIEYAGARYHVMSRGDRREAIFYDDADRQEFLRTLGEACQKTGWQVHAYCLMSNHFHFVIETPQPNLSLGILPPLLLPSQGRPGTLEIASDQLATSDLAARNPWHEPLPQLSVIARSKRWQSVRAS
jgi:hypothetical protein